MKSITTLIMIMIFSIFFSQNRKEVKELIKIDNQYDSILIAYQKKAKDSLSFLSKNERKKVMYDFETKKNQERQEKLLFQLKIIKNIESEFPNSFHAPIKCSNKNFVLPNLTQTKSKYKPTIDENQKKTYNTKENFVKSSVTFVLTPEGYFENINAIGENEKFNRDLEIILYKMEKWMPFCENGFSRTQRFRLPVTLNLKE